VDALSGVNNCAVFDDEIVGHEDSFVLVLLSGCLSFVNPNGSIIEDTKLH